MIASVKSAHQWLGYSGLSGAREVLGGDERGRDIRHEKVGGCYKSGVGSGCCECSRGHTEECRDSSGASRALMAELNSIQVLSNATAL